MGELHGVRLAFLDQGSFVRTHAGEVRPEADRFNRFVEAVARPGAFAEVQYVIPVRELRIWEVEPPLDPIDESAVHIVATRPHNLLPRDRAVIDDAVARSDLLCLRLPGRNARFALSSAREHGVPAIGWLEEGDFQSLPTISPSPNLFASAVSAEEIETSRKLGFQEGTVPRRILWALSAATDADDVRQVAAAITALRARDGAVALAVLSDRPISDATVRTNAEKLLPDGVEFYGYVGDRRSYMDLLRGGGLLMHLSRASGVPAVVVDAQAAGLPVVAADTPALREILGEGDRGRVFQHGDASALARAVDSVLPVADDSDDWSEMRESALRWAAANTAEVHAARFGDRARDLFPTLRW